MSEVEKPVDATATAPVAEQPVPVVGEAAPAATTATETTTPAETKVSEGVPAAAPAAETTAPITTEEPVTADTAATTAAAAPVEGTKATGTTTAETKKEVKPITEGLLGYKAPGLVKSLRFSKRFFWFGEEAVPSTNLQQYLRGEKPDVAHSNVAWSSQTGKGLLYFVKHRDQRAHPLGVINLNDVSDLTKDSFNELHFKLHGQKHAFQASSSTERDGWFATLEPRIAEAKTSAETVTGGAGYKEALHKLHPTGTTAAQPAVAAAVPATKAESSTPKKSTDLAPVEAVKKDNASSSSSSSSDGETDKKEKKKREQKSRSTSRKRTSIFGTFRGKKDEHEEKKAEKKEEKAEKKEEKAEEKAIKQEEKKVEKQHDEVKASETAKAEDAAAAGAAVGAAAGVAAAAEEQDRKDEEKHQQKKDKEAKELKQKEEKEVRKDSASKDKSAKRSSIFGSLFPKKEHTEEKKDKEVVAPALVATGTDTVAPTDKPLPAEPAATTSATVHAPVVLPEEINHSAPETIVTPAAPTTTTTTEAPKEIPIEAKKDESATTPSSVTKESFFGKFLKTEKTKYQEKKEERKEQKAVDSPQTDTVSPVVAASPTPVEPAVPAHTTTSTTPAATETTATPANTDTPVLGNEPTTTTTATGATPTETTPKEKRRSSFFGSLGTKKEKRADVISDSETTEPESSTAAKKNTTPATTTTTSGSQGSGSKLGDIFRRPSRAVKNVTGNKEAKKETPTSTTAAAPVVESPAENTTTTDAAQTAETAHGTEIPASAETTGAATTDAPATSSENQAIGDVVPEAVTVGQQKAPAPVQAAA